MADITVYKHNEAKLFVSASPALLEQLKDHYTYLVPNHRHHILFKKKVWDGKIRIFNPMIKLLPFGLWKDLLNYARDNGYSIHFEFDSFYENIKREQTNEFIESLKLPFSPRPYQVDALEQAIRNKKTFLISPTGSGKSLIIYMIARYMNCKTLIVVPSVSLCRAVDQ